MKLVNLVILAVVMGFATGALGWWGVPLAAAAIAAVSVGRPGVITRHRRSAAGGAALAAVVAWGALLALDAAGPRFGAVTRTLGGVLQVPGAVAVLATLLLPALLAWTAAALAEGLVGRLFPAPPPRGDDGGHRRPVAPAPVPPRRAGGPDVPAKPELASVR